MLHSLAVNLEQERASSGGTTTMSVDHDESLWPVVIATFADNYGIEDLREHLERVTGYLRRWQPFGIVYVLAPRVVSSTEARLLADFNAEHAASLERWVPACAFVSSKRFHRSALSALGWVAPLPFKTHVAQTVEQGVAWVEEMLRSKRQAASEK